MGYWCIPSHPWNTAVCIIIYYYTATLDIGYQVTPIHKNNRSFISSIYFSGGIATSHGEIVLPCFAVIKRYYYCT